jgi:hypothetical protein
MTDGWLVRVEVEAGKGEATPLVFVVAVHDHRDAMEVAQTSQDVAAERAKPRTVDQPWPIRTVELIAPVDSRTLDRLGLAVGGVWNVYKPPLTERIQFAVRP